MRRPGVGSARRMGARGIGGAVPVTPPFLNAVAYWPMDAALPSIRDYTGRGNDLARDMAPAVSTVAFEVGTNALGGQPAHARMAKWGIWHRILTTAEKAALAAGEGWPFSTTTSLQDCKAFYLFNEASAAASFADATGRGNTLTKFGTATVKVAGPLGTDFAVQLGAAGGATALEKNPPTADLTPGNATHTIAGWVNMDDLGATQEAFWGQFDGATALGDAVYYHFANQRFQADLGNNADLYRNAVVVAEAAGAPTTGVWYHLIDEYDAVGNALTLSVNGMSNTLTPIQQPAPVASGSHLAAQFRVNPDYGATALSGWDLVGRFCSASKAVNADLGIGNNAKAVWGWIKLTDVATTQTVMGCFNSTGNVLDWVIQQAGSTLYFLLGNSAGAFDFCFVGLGDTNWHSFVAWHDKTGDGKIHIVLDGATAGTPVTVTVTPATGSLPFIMGNCTTGATRGQQLKGKLAYVGISNGAPSAAEIARHYALGAGLT